MQKGKFHYIVMGASLTLVVIFFLFTLLLPNAQAGSIASTTIDKVGNREELASNQPENHSPIASEPLAQTEQEKVALLAERQRLIDKWEETITSGHGWIHSIVKYETSQRESDPLPNGNTIPSDYIMEEWFLVGEDGIVTMMVGTMKDLNGKVIQFATYQNGKWYSSGLDQQSEGIAPSFGSGMSFEIDQVSSISLEQADNRVIITITQLFPPMFLDDLERVVNGNIIREVFDSVTGQKLQQNTIFVLEKGGEYQSSIYQVLTTELVKELPKEVEDLLNSQAN